MIAQVLYFAAARDAAGRAEETVDLPPEVDTVGAFVEWLMHHRPGLEPHRGSVRIARNETLAPREDRLAEGDVLAVLPPSAGG